MGIPELFGSMVFDRRTMHERLPRDVYRAVLHTMDTGESLDSSVANVVANAMKDWAIEKGATHFTHWFQPMTGVTAEKHDSFISPAGEGRVIMEFSGKELIKGEPDASSFPSGGLRATFEARGYTGWDPTSCAFIKENTLCIPTAFYSYSGEALDKKTPLLRSIAAINAQALRVLNSLGEPAELVTPTVGAEQEYFLISKELYDRRKDLLYTGRTLFGAKPPKGQELDDHFFGSIKPRVLAYMKDLDEELWKLGVFAKTEHNEVAPAQHELAPLFETANIACDHNQLIMEVMQKVAHRHGLVCLLHEKPFDGVNGSGKHNNWSLSTDTGKNLLDPGKAPAENTVFLTFLAAIIKAVDEHSDLLRIASSSAGNDHRLGGNEAPPAIVSMFVGTDIENVLEAIAQGKDYIPDSVGVLDTSVEALPNLYRDTTDRNRTSPLAFTGNKFEFRMLGAPTSISDVNVVLNTITADALGFIADRLEAGESAHEIIRTILRDNGRIIFNGNNYAAEWVSEAEKRGLINFRSAADALPHFSDEKNVALFERHRVFSRAEIASRTEVMLESYCKIIAIEAHTMVEMVNKEVLPSALAQLKDLSETAVAKKTVSADLNCEYETKLTARMSELCASIYRKVEALERALLETKNHAEAASRARYCRAVIFEAMESLRESVDALESLVGDKYRTYPTYGELLFGV